MKQYSDYTEICTCHNCGSHLHYNPYSYNIYNGGPWYCGSCCANVTDDIYGKKENTSIKKSNNNVPAS